MAWDAQPRYIYKQKQDIYIVIWNYLWTWSVENVRNCQTCGRIFESWPTLAKVWKCQRNQLEKVTFLCFFHKCFSRLLLITSFWPHRLLSLPFSPTAWNEAALGLLRSVYTIDFVKTFFLLAGWTNTAAFIQSFY